MHALALLCLAAVAVAKPQGFRDDAVTTVTERSYTIRGEADKYYGANGISSYSNGISGYSGYAAYPYAYPSYTYSQAAAPARAYHTYFQQAPAFRTYQAPAYQAYQQAFHAYQAPAFQAPAFQAPAFQAVTAAPAVSYTAAPALSYAAAPAVSYAAAPEAAFETATAAPALAYPTATVAPALAFPTATVAPALAFPTATVAPVVAVRQDFAPEAKVYKHVYAFAAPEEPATRALVRVEAPVSKRKHYKLVFIKAPSQQAVVDSDITLPAQEEEKTLIYVLSKDGKQEQPEVRIKQAEAFKHAKPEVFFLKYKNEAEAQAIASSTISGQTADVPAEGEVISDGSVSVLGQDAGAAFNADTIAANFETDVNNFEAPAVESAYRSQSALPALVYRAGISNQPAHISTVSTGTVGIVPVTPAPAAPITVVGEARDAGFAGYSTGFAYGRAVESEEPVNVAIKVNSEPTAVVETSTQPTF